MSRLAECLDATVIIADGEPVKDEQNQPKVLTLTEENKWKKSTEPDDPDKPGKPGEPGKPGTGTRTGDETKFGLWLTVSLIAAAGLLGVLIWRRRRRED